MVGRILELTIKDLLGYAVFATGTYFVGVYAWEQIQNML